MQTKILEEIFEIDKALKSMPRDRRLGGIKQLYYSKKRALRMKLSKKIGNHSFNDIKKMLEKNSFMCSFCGSKEKPSKDHIIPISKGGSNSITNIQILCIKCNSKKGNRYAE